MGLPMAKRVLGAGFPTVTACHRRRAPAEELESLGARVLGSPAEVARAANAVVTILPADAELRACVFAGDGLLAGFSPGKTLIDMTTSTPASLQEVETAISAAGGRVLDAPVSGGTTAAAEGKLTIMVGGEAGLLEEFRPLLAAMGTRIVHVGPLGMGKVVKMVNQSMAALHLLAIGEAFALGVKCGADPQVLLEVIKISSGYSKMMDLRLPDFLLAGAFQPGFKLDLMKKDVHLALDSARSLGAPMLLTAVAAQIFSAASAAGKGDADFSAAAAYVAAQAGVDLNQAVQKVAADQTGGNAQ
jgi:3-hydroxyisobutyrate dehydrogenase-like beta-hydroxyacid dehydrogenase